MLVACGLLVKISFHPIVGSRKKHSNSPKKIKYKSEHSSIVMRFRIKLDIMQFCYVCSVGNFESRPFINFH
jgi:hypothetical protein